MFLKLTGLLLCVIGLVLVVLFIVRKEIRGTIKTNELINEHVEKVRKRLRK